MIQSLLLIVVILALACLFLLLFYRRKFGKSFWQANFTADSNIEEILFIQIPTIELKLDDQQQAELELLKQHKYRIVGSFSISVIPEAKCVFLKNSKAKFWVCCFYFIDKNFIAFSTLLDNNKMLTITNLSGKRKQSSKKMVRFNREDLDCEALLPLLAEIKSTKTLLTFKDYIHWFKRLFTNDLIRIYQQDIEQAMLMAPSFYSSFERENLFKAYTKKNNMREEALLEKSAQILVVNSDSYVEYLVSRLLVQVPNISQNKTKLIESAEQADDIKVWFRSINNHLPEDKKFIYMGNVAEPIDSDFYFCQRISVSDSSF